jgi:hypothetical protein
VSMWNFLPAGQLVNPHGSATGTRVARVGTVSFVRSGFARVRWDDGRISDEWLADLVATDERQRDGD